MRTSLRNSFWTVTQKTILSHDSDSDQDKTEQDDTQWINKAPSGWKIDMFCSG